MLGNRPENGRLASREARRNMAAAVLPAVAAAGLVAAAASTTTPDTHFLWRVREKKRKKSDWVKRKKNKTKQNKNKTCTQIEDTTTTKKKPVEIKFACSRTVCFFRSLKRHSCTTHKNNLCVCVEIYDYMPQSNSACNKNFKSSLKTIFPKILRTPHKCSSIILQSWSA